MRRGGLIIIFTLLASASFAQEFKNISVYNDANNIYINAFVEPEFNEQILSLIDSGRQCTNVAIFEIVEDFPGGNAVSQNAIVKIVKWNNWANRYDIVINPGTAGQQIVVAQTQAEMSRIMRSYQGVWLISKSKIVAARSYYLRARAEFRGIKLLPPLGWILNSLYNFKTNWMKLFSFEGRRFL